jgi:hypothetical protein
MKLNPFVIGAAVAGVYYLLSSRKASAATLTPAVTPAQPVTPVAPKKVVTLTTDQEVVPVQIKSGTNTWGNSGYQQQNKSGLDSEWDQVGTVRTIQLAPPTYDAYGVQIIPAKFADYDSSGKQVGAAYYGKSDAQSGVIRRHPGKRFGR